MSMSEKMYEHKCENSGNDINKYENRFDFLIPFSRMTIYFENVSTFHKPSKLLYEHSGGSGGTLSHGKVYLKEGETDELIYEYSEQSEYGPQYDREYTILVWLVRKAESVDYIPLREWIMSINADKFKPYADKIEINNGQWYEGPWRELPIMWNERPDTEINGWHLSIEHITARHRSYDTPPWSLCHLAVWEDTSSDKRYHYFLEARLRDYYNVKMDEELRKLTETLPWRNPIEADKNTDKIRSWYDIEKLCKKEEYLNEMVKKYPYSSGYSESLADVQKQFELLLS